MSNLIEENKQQVYNICKTHNIKELYLFGSVLTDKFNAQSDIDILVQFDNNSITDYFSNYMEFKEKLEKLFKRTIDIVESQAIRNPIFKKVLDKNKVLFYERDNTQIII